MNEFEKNVQSKRHDIGDSAMGFVASFGFFTILFVIAVAIKAIGA
ncbi:YqzM family protein [Cytobacillus sp. FSL W7-1323]|uniref:YqzM family protein n=2 Tax=Cytobacillus TaxID=2675230 RepID=A0A248TL34_9BACI|nr:MULTISPECIES: YqzM family protein [Cytobacillus]ASV68934.1 YqzM family protein [Cytobacillus kochii]MBD7935785.1 YqzM family protein [Cytobacillus stercorigallinarum]MCA1025413.1 YqzM family protein [Cytobacillus kochii]MCM3324609.1 YqzM family protein [Cytobacillus kochii]MCM3347002.1 YqzM family protein [Cytobacillus kochii]